MADQDISPEPTEAPAGESQVAEPSEGAGAPTHYKTLEDADAAARKFQGKSDRLEAEMDRLLTLPDKSRASLDDLIQFRDRMLTISERADFPDFVSGKSKPSGEATTEEPEFLTETERAVRDKQELLEKKVDKQTLGLAEIHYRGLQDQIKDDWSGLLEPYREKAHANFLNIVKLGAVDDLSKMDRKFVEDLYLQQVPLEDRRTLFEKIGQMEAERKLQHQQARGTTVPSPERPSTEQLPPKNLEESLRRGIEFARAEQARG